MSEDAPRPVDVVVSAEVVDVGTRTVPRERVRLLREVVSEEVTLTVVVRREVLRVEREPLTGDAPSGGASRDAGPDGAGPDGAGPAAGERPPVEVVLSEERPVVSLEVVPYERVRAQVHRVDTTTRVDTTHRREVVDLTRDGPRRPR